MSSRIEDCLSPDVAPNGCACSGLHVTSDNHDCGPGMRKVTTSLPTLRGRLLRAYVSLAEGAVVGRIFNAKAAPVDTPWMWPSGTMETARRRTVMSRRARLRWRHSRRVGGARARPSTVWNGAGSGMVQLAPPQSSNIGYDRTASDWEKTMHAIGLVLLGIAIMPLLLTDADAQRRSSAQGSQAAGAKGSWCAVHPRHGGENCGYTSFDQCWATAGAEGGWCRPNPFSGTPYGTGYTWSGPKR